MRGTDNGTDASGDGDYFYTPESTAQCGSCEHWATVAAFEPEAEVQP